mmetsp:Transcript_19956/g.35616  ORF Transcript_19956/g.35616 Transcript_19956/m.35616 type:complete len:182 (+) Transcript_19956:26-571(+)
MAARSMLLGLALFACLASGEAAAAEATIDEDPTPSNSTDVSEATPVSLLETQSFTPKAGTRCGLSLLCPYENGVCCGRHFCCPSGFQCLGDNQCRKRPVVVQKQKTPQLRSHHKQPPNSNASNATPIKKKDKSAAASIDQKESKQREEEKEDGREEGNEELDEDEEDDRMYEKEKSLYEVG